MIFNDSNKDNYLSLFFPLLLGVSAFFIVVGPNALSPENIVWLGAGDPAQHYLGWHFYRSSDWDFPIGLNPYFGLEISNSIVYSDSNPLFAIFFKAINFLLPPTFQYFGIWLLSCFVLQAIFAWKLVGLATDKVYLRLLGTGLLVFSPPMIWRFHGHFSLMAHFLILASLYFSFNKNLTHRKLSWGLLIAVAALVHAYLLFMVLALWSVDLISRTWKSHLSWINALCEFICVFILLGFVCWQAGYFSVSGGVGGDGIGYYRMNLLSPFDSSGWSYVLKDIPESAGDYEGFNYLGLGTIILLILSFPFMVRERMKVKRIIVDNPFFSLLLLFFFLYAITNTFAIGLFEFKYYLPGFFLEKASVFRATGRIFWPVFYVITFSIIFCTIRRFKTPVAGIFLGIALVVQIVDTSAGWLPIRNKNMAEQSDQWNSPLVSPFWVEASKKYANVRRIPVGNHNEDWLTFAYYAGKNNLHTDSIYLARVDSGALHEAQHRAYESLRSGKLDRDSLYILDDPSFRVALLSGDAEVDLMTRVDGFNVLAPGWKSCVDCNFFDEGAKIQDLLKPISLEDGGRIEFSENELDYLLEGWSSPEPWGVWSNAQSAVVLLPIDPSEVGSISIDFNAFVNETHPTQRLTILVNGIKVFSDIVAESDNEIEFQVPEVAKLGNVDEISIEFLLPDAASPLDLGLSEDRRTLAMGLQAISLKE